MRLGIDWRRERQHFNNNKVSVLGSEWHTVVGKEIFALMKN